MDGFLKIHEDELVGTLSTFDRLIFKGHLTGFFPDGAFSHFLARQGVLLKEFKGYVAGVSAGVKAHAQAMAEKAGRPFIYLPSAHTKAQGCSKEDRAREIAREDGIEEGLVGVFSVLEPCRSFTVQGNRRRFAWRSSARAASACISTSTGWTPRTPPEALPLPRLPRQQHLRGRDSFLSRNCIL